MSFEITLRASVTTAITVMPSLPPVSTPKFGRRVFIGRLRLQVSEELANVTSITVVGAGAGLRRLGALGELLVEYTVLQPEGSEEDTSEHVEALMAQVYANSTALTATNAMAEVDPEFAASRTSLHSRSTARARGTPHGATLSHGRARVQPQRWWVSRALCFGPCCACKASALTPTFLRNKVDISKTLKLGNPMTTMIVE
ncbi:unnamed protein product [Durusdinium trenchii]|uniref:Uncharacterized protein n=1 Tax=Durusdinium trenchii TaxID=1381693 RepID=A0ABP0NLB5_9DINO